MTEIEQETSDTMRNRGLVPSGDHWQCPKCKKLSGDDWSQCEGSSCPVVGSPHYIPLTAPNERK